MLKPHVVRITEVNPRLRRIHVAGEVHPGELAARGYVRRGNEWVLDLRRPDAPGRDADGLVAEFEALSALGYGFAEGDEWSPAELYRKHLGSAGGRGGAPWAR
jgi:hypothetical protein